MRPGWEEKIEEEGVEARGQSRVPTIPCFNMHTASARALGTLTWMG